MTAQSKPLRIDDTSAFEFVKEMLAGDPTYAINFDRIQWDAKAGRYVIVEFLLCDEAQFERGITPFTSHPNRYFDKNGQKFISLWQLAEKLGATLLLVNYAKKGTAHEDDVLVMEVRGMNPADERTPVSTRDRRMSRAEFSRRFRALNQRGNR